MSHSTSIAVVTGGNRGLGKSAALHVAAKGTDVILTYRANQAEAEAVVTQIEATGRRAQALHLDVANSASFANFATQLREILNRHWQRESFNFLVNNAGISIHATIAEMTETQFDQLVNIHFKGVFFLTQKLLPLIADGGRIVNVSSGLSRFCMPGYGAYGSMKGAIEVLSRYMAKEFGPRRIAVNVIAPGAIETDFGNGAVRDNKQLNAQIASSTALGRVGLPDDIGGAIAALLSPDNAWVNGQRIEVSGGMML